MHRLHVFERQQSALVRLFKMYKNEKTMNMTCEAFHVNESCWDYGPRQCPVHSKHEEGSISCLLSFKLKAIRMYEVQFDITSSSTSLNSYDAVDIDVKVVVD
jgi:hypothetical protein